MDISEVASESNSDSSYRLSSLFEFPESDSEAPDYSTIILQLTLHNDLASILNRNCIDLHDPGELEAFIRK